jgi:hypothetical protein
MLVLVYRGGPKITLSIGLFWYLLKVRLISVQLGHGPDTPETKLR